MASLFGAIGIVVVVAFLILGLIWLLENTND